MAREITLFSHMVEALEEKIAYLAKRAEKLGIPAPTFEIVREYDSPVTVDGVKYVERFVVVEVAGEVIRTEDGWTVIGIVEDAGEHGTVVSLLPVHQDETHDLTRFHNTTLDCDRCGLERNRNKVLILWHEGRNEYQQLGGNCAHIVVGIDPERIASFYDMVNSFEIGGGERRERFVSSEAVVAAAVAIVRVDGAYIGSRDRYGERVYGTGQRVKDWLDDYQDTRKTYKVSQQDRDRANEILAFFRGIQQPTEGRLVDWLANVWTVAQNDYCRANHVGLLVSAVKAIDAMTAEPDFAPGYFAPVSKTFHRAQPMTLVSKGGFDTRFGFTKVFTFRHDETGQQVTAFFSGEKFNAEVGDSVVVDFKVKAHDTYNGYDQTKVNFIKFSKGHEPG